jgi:integrase/recombinase XerD
VEFLEYARDRKYSNGSIRQYAYALRKFMAFLTGQQAEAQADGIRWQDVTPEVLAAFCCHLKECQLSAGGQDCVLRPVRKFIRWMVAQGRIFSDPTENLVIPLRKRGLVIPPTEEEVAKLLGQPDTRTPIGIRDRAILEIAYGCGLRRSELAGLTMGDFDLKHATLRVVGKGQKERVVPLGRHAMRWLRVYLTKARPVLVRGDCGAARQLWLSRMGRSTNGAAIRQQLRRYIDQAGIRTPTDLHGLRRACATHMLRNGAHPIQIQMLLGHAGMRHLSQYLSVTIRDLKATHGRSRPGQ